MTIETIIKFDIVVASIITLIFGMLTNLQIIPTTLGTIGALIIIVGLTKESLDIVGKILEVFYGNSKQSSKFFKAQSFAMG